AYGVSLGGAEIGTLRIRRVDTDSDLPEQITRTRYARPSWIGEHSFLYSRLPEPTPDGEQRLTGGRVYVHQLGTDPSGDIAVFGPSLVAGHDISSDFFFHGIGDPSGSMEVGVYDAGLTGSPRIVFVAPKADIGPDSAWRQVTEFDDEIRGV